MKDSVLLQKFLHFEETDIAKGKFLIQRKDCLYLNNSGRRILLAQRIVNNGKKLILNNIRFRKLKLGGQIWDQFFYKNLASPDCEVIEVSSSRFDCFSLDDFIYEILTALFYIFSVGSLDKSNLLLLPLPEWVPIELVSKMLKGFSINTRFSLNDFIYPENGKRLCDYLERNGKTQILGRIVFWGYRELSTIRTTFEAIYPVDHFYETPPNYKKLLLGLLVYGADIFAIKCSKMLEELEKYVIEERHHGFVFWIDELSTYFDPPLFTSGFLPVAKLFSIIRILNSCNDFTDSRYLSEMFKQ